MVSSGNQMKAFQIPRIIRSFAFALQGAKVLLVTQPNARIHGCATVAVAACGYGCRVSPHEWALLVFAITLVWMAEALNTALEFLADEISTEKREGIGKAKDLGAFAVLIGAIGSVVVGGIVFIPHLLCEK